MKRPTQCKSCGAPIHWATTEAGKSIPVDAGPVHNGNILLTLRQSTGELFAKVYAPSNVHNIPPGRNRYQAHFVSCPNADDHRRK